MGKRRRARELTLQGQYALELSGNPIETVISELGLPEKDDEEVVDFAVSLLRRAYRHKMELDAFVMETVKNWRYERIALLDRLILRQALCEMLFFEEIPPKVSINEAIDLAKKYSTDESGRFVNGILDALLQRFKKEQRLTKTGRGLLE